MSKPWAKRNSVRRHREICYKNRLHSEARNTNGFPGLVIKEAENGKTYIKIYSRGKISKYLKVRAHRAERRHSDLPHRGGYKKSFDYWWSLY